MRVKLEEVCKRIYAGGDVPKDRYSEVKTKKYPIPIYANAEKDNGLYGYTDKAREEELSITVAARGTIGFTAIRREPFLPVVRLITVVPDTEKVSERYLYYVLKKCKPQSSGTSIPQLTVPDIKKNRLELYDISEQERIADQLDKVSKVIELRKQELEALDNLIKARFVEMFGDPVVHLYKGETVKLDTIADKITVGFVGEASNEYVDEGVPYLRTQNVRVNRIDLKGLIYVNESFHNKNQKSIIHPGDVVISRVGANRGMAAMVPDSLPEANIANCLIVGQTDNINSYYLAFYMNMSFGKRPQFGASVGSAQGVVNTSILKKWEVYVPDRKLQDDFFEFSNQVDKSKVAVQKALKETQLLFDSLMQQYFG